MAVEASMSQHDPGPDHLPDYDKTLCECDLEPLQHLVEGIER